MNKIIAITLVTLYFLNCHAQPAKWKSNKHFTIVNYNVENLFDTVNTPGKMDTEFTPTGKKLWNTERYNEKLTNLSKVLASINSFELPEIIGLTEVENRKVLEDLTTQGLLKSANYQIVHDDGPDPRGIDCALLYRADAFTYHSHRSIEVRYPFANNARTRDILYVKGLVKKDTLHLFVNHWSSRRGGKDKTEIKRVTCAQVLKSKVDSILALDSNNKVFIMGDFNDNPNNKSLNQVMDAGRIGEDKLLKNLMFAEFDQGNGSYFYKGKFDMLDNLLVTNGLIQSKKGFRLIEAKGFIFKAEFLNYTDKKGNVMPSRSYGGPNYYGGYSDHYPTYTYFYEK